jgi:site-specific recombinase XerD
MKHLPLNTLHERLVDEFNKTLKVIGYHRGKDSPYPILLREFLHFLERNNIPDVKKCTGSDVDAFHKHLVSRKNQRRSGNVGRSHHNQIMFSMRKFFDFLLDTNEIEDSPAFISSFQWGEIKEREVLTLKEIDLVFANCKTQLEKAIIAVAYGCGLRRSEIAHLKRRDVLFSEQALIVRDGKNHKNRTVLLTSKVKEILFDFIVKDKYGNDKGGDYDQLVFVSENKIPVPKNSFNLIFKAVVRRTANETLLKKNISLHSLRHSIAVHMLNSGAEMDFVRRFLGHTSIDTTTIYTRKRRQKINMQRRVLKATRHLKPYSYAS